MASLASGNDILLSCYCSACSPKSPIIETVYKIIDMIMRVLAFRRASARLFQGYSSSAWDMRGSTTRLPIIGWAKPTSRRRPLPLFDHLHRSTPVSPRPISSSHTHYRRDGFCVRPHRDRPDIWDEQRDAGRRPWVLAVACFSSSAICGGATSIRD